MQTGVFIYSVLITRRCVGVNCILGDVGFGVTFVRVLAAHYCGVMPVSLKGLEVAGNVGEGVTILLNAI